MKRPIPTRYTSTAKFLHWLIAIFLLAQLALGFWMIGIPNTPPGVQAKWFNLHKSIGLTLGLIILVRLAWRWTYGAPALPDSIPAWERTVAKFCHRALYVCMVVMPLSGYLGSSFTRYPIRYFGQLLPRWGWESPALKELCSQVHFATVVVFCLLVTAHVAAVLKHLILDRDEIFQRMGWATPGGGRAVVQSAAESVRSQ